MQFLKSKEERNVDRQIEKLFEDAIEELLFEERFLLERSSGKSSNRYNMDNDSTKWSETIVGKLFGKITNVLTLNGFLTKKFKDIFGVKSNLLKVLATKLEATIDKIPAEYLNKSTELDLDSRKLAYYDEMKKLAQNFENPNLNKEQALTILSDFIAVINSLSVDLDTTNKDVALFNDVLKNKKKQLETLEKKFLKEDPLRKPDFGKLAKSVLDKVEAISKYNQIAAKLKMDMRRTIRSDSSSFGNSMQSDKLSGGVSSATKSMYDVVAIINKAHDLYTNDETSDEDRDKDTNKDQRLFKIWEAKLLDVMSRKSDIIPEPLMKYMNSSLKPNFSKFNVGSDKYGNSSNVLDELANITNIVKKAELNRKRDIASNKPVDVMDTSKSSSSKFDYKLVDKGVKIQDNNLKNSPLIIKIHNGELHIEDKKYSASGKYITILPVKMTSSNKFSCVVSITDDFLDNLTTTSGFLYDSSTLNTKFMDTGLLEDLGVEIDEFYYAVTNVRNLNLGGTFELICYDPNKDIKTLVNTNTYSARIVVNTIESIHYLHGLDNKPVYLDSKQISDRFKLGGIPFKTIDQYFSTNNKMWQS